MRRSLCRSAVVGTSHCGVRPRSCRRHQLLPYLEGMVTSRIVQLRLGAFKSFRGSVLPLGGTTLLTGRNSSGKSNALDGLEVLARLAEGEDLVDALDGRRREGGAVRGGSVGCAPHGTNSFELGCSVELGSDRYDYDLEIEVRPDLRIISERLQGPGVAVSSGKISFGPLVETKSALSAGTGIEAELHNGKRGKNPPHKFRDSRLIISQIPLALSGSDVAEQSVLKGSDAVLVALRGGLPLRPSSSSHAGLRFWARCRPPANRRELVGRSSESRKN
ncbi:AAA family ATPase [Rathayibacter tritici]|uniref:ATPase AAA-type core domain-containing protein n=1 Tax=Rathayibacter tritici TaxID=33888 RepID=A0A160KVE1_9MICO|nr:hypothetical protein A6122_2563 [Rathayibacter tritici]